MIKWSVFWRKQPWYKWDTNHARVCRNRGTPKKLQTGKPVCQAISNLAPSKYASEGFPLGLSCLAEFLKSVITEFFGLNACIAYLYSEQVHYVSYITTICKPCGRVKWLVCPAFVLVRPWVQILVQKLAINWKFVSLSFTWQYFGALPCLKATSSYDFHFKVTFLVAHAELNITKCRCS